MEVNFVYIFFQTQLRQSEVTRYYLIILSNENLSHYFILLSDSVISQNYPKSVLHSNKAVAIFFSGTLVSRPLFHCSTERRNTIN